MYTVRVRVVYNKYTPPHLLRAACAAGGHLAGVQRPFVKFELAGGRRVVNATRRLVDTPLYLVGGGLGLEFLFNRRDVNATRRLVPTPLYLFG